MKKYLFLASFFAFSLAIFSSCRKDTTTFDGPNIEETLGTFRILENFKSSKDSVAFASAENVNFTAKFNKVANWTITVTGKLSKAKKIITGQSKNIDFWQNFKLETRVILHRSQIYCFAFKTTISVCCLIICAQLNFT